MSRVHGVDDRAAIALVDWQMTTAPPVPTAGPEDVIGASWIAAEVPGTAASAHRLAGDFRFETCPAFDRCDVWYRARFQKGGEGGVTVLRFAGLATLAEVWVDGELRLSSSNMFHAHEIDVTALPEGAHTLSIRFRSVHAELAVRRPRPRWRTRLVDNQQLRWIRTTILGRIPAWSPPVPAVGPFRPVSLQRRDRVAHVGASIQIRLDGADAVVDAALEVLLVGTAAVTGATLRVGDTSARLSVSLAQGTSVLRGTLRIPGVALWWPHTHGAPILHDVRVTLDVDGTAVTIDLGRTGFRSLERVPGDGFGLSVNGVDVFCRGACWTPLDVVSLSATREQYRDALTLARDAGMNMIRVGGTMAYEDDAFYELCDELGILVFQDFMFANMDYPADDPAFRASVEREARELVLRLGASPCLAVACGSSEVEQQAAMVGMPRESWTNSLFQEILPTILRERRPDVVYVPSTPTGGAMPFHVDVGVGHYFGVGAYLRPFEDARRAGVRFAAECLAFANVPSDEAVEELLVDGQAPPTSAAWKARVARDAGTGWDFEDVRDHYVRELFAVDPARVRYGDVTRYLELGRVASGEAMARTFGEWRRAGSPCRGGLVWFYRDLWPGAGWGVVDSAGRPKSAYYYLKRALAPLSLFASDEGVNGVELGITNDHAAAFDGFLEVTLLRDGETVVATATTPVFVEGRGRLAVRADAVLPHFFDTTYAYRFGPPGFRALVARLRSAEGGAPIATTCFFPGGLGHEREDVGLEAEATRGPDGVVEVTLRTARLAQAVALDAVGFAADDSHFHLPPGEPRTVLLRPRRLENAPSATRRFEGWATPLNGTSKVRIKLP